MSNQVEPYRFEEKFERSVAVLCARSPRFWGVIGHALDPAALGAEPAKLLVQAVQQIARQMGSGPSNTTVVIQRLSTWVTIDGKLKREQLQAVVAYLDDAEDAGIAPETEVIAELVPVLQRRMRQEALQEGLHDFGKHGDLDRTEEMLGKAKRLGVNDNTLGLKLNAFDATMAELEMISTLDRLPIGIMELDEALDGGIPRSTLSVFLGGAGDGKSMALSHTAAHAMLNGLHVLYATLELPTNTVCKRIYANLTGVAINDIEKDRDKVRELMESLGDVGPLYAKAFTPLATTCADFREWVKESEDREGRKVDLLCIDYADLMGSGGTEKSHHDTMRLVYQGLRTFAVEHSFWALTASQSQGRGERDSHKGKKKPLDLQHVAHSVDKVRIADLVVSLNLDESEMGFYLGKNRNGRAREIIGPVSTNFACGQIGPVARKFGTTLTGRLESLHERDAARRMGATRG
jgi:hypothetical protein